MDRPAGPADRKQEVASLDLRESSLGSPPAAGYEFNQGWLFGGPYTTGASASGGT
jgi:hypothetical protein